jgi:hypothetical protein
MTYDVIHVAEQRPVGQGGFHVGWVVSTQDYVGWGHPDWPVPPDGISYVYDCGAMPRYKDARAREIQAVCQRFPNARLDILFLSHFHADHVNGLPALLSKKTGLAVDTIIMPWVDHLERMVVYGRALEIGAARPSDAFYRSLVVDPVSALGRFGPRQIVQFREAGPDDEPPSGEEPGRPDGEIQPGGSREADRERRSGWGLIGRGSVRHRQAQVGPGAAAAVFDVDGAVAVQATPDAGDWLLAPYVQGGRLRKATFLRALAKELSLSIRQTREAIDDPERRLHLVTDNATALRNAYRAVERDLNLTSMSLFSGPRPSANLKEHRWRDSFLFLPSTDRLHWHGEDCAWIATGDADLANLGRRRSFVRYFKKLRPNIGTLVLPHHGSEHNFHKDLLAELKPNLCLANADSYSNWRHPATSVVQAVASSGAVCHVVTADERSGLREISRIWSQ